MIGDVFADVGHRSIGADNHFGIFVGLLRAVLLLRAFASGFSPSASCRCARPRHHPAALVLAFGFEVEHAGLLQLLKGQRPEIQVQNLALARQKIVLDVEPQHGFKMAPEHRGRNQLGNFGGLVAALLDLVQCRVAQLLPRLVLVRAPARVPLRSPRIEIPAVVINRVFKSAAL